jgi:osmotically-inducible protein OsmY
MIAVTRAMFSSREQPQFVGMPFQWHMSDDDDLAERVRVDLSGIPTTRAIEVLAARGRVSLRGTVRRDEHDAAVELARAVSGVKEVEDLLECEDPAQK